jgi:DNA-binding response OmpR family regulator
MKKILIVEDELAYLRLLHDQLTKKGYTVYEATNGEKGLKKAKKEKPDLILLDLKMPGMDGMTMLDLLRKEKIGEKTGVIILTNLEPNKKILEKMITDKPLYYFIKSDIKFTDLLKKIEQILKN